MSGTRAVLTRGVFVLLLLCLCSKVGSSPAEDTHLGCYQKSNLQEISQEYYPTSDYTGRRVGLKLNTSLEKCRSYCAREYRTTFFGLKRTGSETTHVKCFCGNTLPPSVGRQCDHNCPGFNCGGSRDNVSVYSVCPRGFYTGREGEPCSKQCYCLDGDLCSLSGGHCPRGCQSGWTGVDCGKDVNECDVDNGGCDQLCINKSPGYVCGCRTGYNLIWDNGTCSDIDECLEESNNTCKPWKERCWNIEGSYVCCPNGTNYNIETDICEVGSARFYVSVTVGCAVAGCVALVAIVILSALLYFFRKSNKKNKARVRLSMALSQEDKMPGSQVEESSVDTYLTPVSLVVPQNNKKKAQLTLPITSHVPSEDRYVATPTSQPRSPSHRVSSTYATIDEALATAHVSSSRSLTRDETTKPPGGETYMQMDRRGSQELLDTQLKGVTPHKGDKLPPTSVY